MCESLFLIFFKIILILSNLVSIIFPSSIKKNFKMENMNNSNPELIIYKIGRYLPFIYPTLDVYKISFIFFFALLAYILSATIAVTIIKNWKTSNYLNSSYFKVVVFGLFIDILNSFIFYLLFPTINVGIVVEHLEENAKTVHLVIWVILRVLTNWTDIIQSMNFLFIAIIRFLSIFYPNSHYQYIDKNYLYFQILLIIYSAIILLLSNTYCSLPYVYKKERFYTDYKSGTFTCKYPFNYTKNDYYFIKIALVHSATIISIILTIIIVFKINKLNKTPNKFSVNAVKKRKKEKRMTCYIIVLGTMQLFHLIQNQIIYINIKINGYDESIRYITYGLRPFVPILCIFLNALSIILISKTLRDAVFKNLKLDTIYKKLYKKNVILPSSQNLKIIQNMNHGTKKKIII